LTCYWRMRDVPRTDEGMYASNVDRMLDSSVKPATAEKYTRIWDKWAAFTAFHKVDVMPPEVRA
jgi:hypothetical protein